MLYATWQLYAHTCAYMSQQQTTDVLALAAGKDGKVRYDDYVKVTKGT